MDETQPSGTAPPAASTAPTAPAPRDDASLSDTAAGWLSQIARDNTLTMWITAAIIAAAILLAFWIVRALLVARLKRIAARTSQGWDDLLLALVADVRWWLAGAIAIFIGTRALALPEGLHDTIRLLAGVATGIQLLLSSRLVIDFGIRLLLDKNKGPDGKPDPTLASGVVVIRFIATLVVGVTLLLLILANQGIEITPLLTGLGIGGIAVALAAQNVLSDLFGSLTILFDKPFLVGDFIIAGDKMGTVEKIGVKTTRVRALTGEMLVFSNSDLLSSRIQNFKQMQERRVLFSIGVVYDTPPQKLRAIPSIVREAVEHQGVARFDRCHFKTFGAYSLDFETVYFVKDPDFAKYMDAQQAINLELFERFAAEGIEFAFPTQVEIVRSGDNTDAGETRMHRGKPPGSGFTPQDRAT